MSAVKMLWLLLLLLLFAEDSQCDEVTTVEPLMVLPDELKASRGNILSAQFECYLKIINDPPYEESGPYCNRTWDGWLCWGDSSPGVAIQLCPEYFIDFDPAEKVTKVCNPYGQWFRHPESSRLWSNYTQCSAYTKDRLKLAFNLYYMAMVGQALSVVSLIISLCIFSYFKSLSCQRISLHKNMFFSFILNSIFTVTWLSAVVNKQQLVASNPVFCKVLSVLKDYTSGTNYFWMLCEGIYLHTLIIVAVFVGEQQLCWYYLLGWGFPVVPAATHALARWLFYNDKCWISPETQLVHIIHGPIHIALLVNLFFLLNIVRVLITKLKVTHSAESNAYMKVVRATLILVPLLGVHFVLVPWRPEGRVALAVYDFVMSIFTHFQGLLVAVMFCFCNGEVQAALKRQWRQYRVQGQGHRRTSESQCNYHTNSTITEVSRVSVSVNMGSHEAETLKLVPVNGQSNGKQCANGEREILCVLETSDI